MIWAIVSKAEMGGYGVPNVFPHYQKALGKDNVQLAVVDVNNPLDFIKKNDIAFLRTANENLIQTIKGKDCKSNAENYELYKIVDDKYAINKLLRSWDVLVPRSYRIDSLDNGHTYFVKPRYGSDSKGISKNSICNSVSEVNLQTSLLDEALIEDFIDGEEYTMSCAIFDDGKIRSASVRVQTDKSFGIQTQNWKLNQEKWKGYKVKREKSKAMQEICEFIINRLKIKHHVRIDFREDKNGRLYVIDVNLLPSMGPLCYWAKCWYCSYGLTYKESVQLMINTAT